MKKRSFINRLRRESIVKTIVTLLILCIILFTFYKDNQEERYFDLFLPRCEVKTIEQLNQCWQKNRFVKISGNTFYTTEYVYTERNRALAVFIDLDLEGKSLITVLNHTKLDALLSQETYTIEGRLETNENKAIEDARKQIIEEYKQQGETQEEKDLIESSILPGVLNEYQGKPASMILSLILYVVLTILFTYTFLKNLYLSIFIQKHRALKTYSDEDLIELEKEYQELSAKKHIFFGDDYFFKLGFITSHIAKIEDIIWIYERKIHSNKNDTNRPLIMNMINGHRIHVKAKQEEKESLIKKIIDKNQNLIVGYTNDNYKKYNALIKEKKKRK